MKINQNYYTTPGVLVCELTHIVTAWSPPGGKAKSGGLGCMVRELLDQARQKYGDRLDTRLMKLAGFVSIV